MQQTKLSSLIETVANVIIGFSLNYMANLIILPIFGFHVSLLANFELGLLYTIVSVVRSYCLRRWFNSHLHDASASLALWWVSISARFITK
jgi:hypothetical protein